MVFNESFAPYATRTELAVWTSWRLYLSRREKHWKVLCTLAFLSSSRLELNLRLAMSGESRWSDCDKQDVTAANDSVHGSCSMSSVSLNGPYYWGYGLPLGCCAHDFTTVQRFLMDNVQGSDITLFYAEDSFFPSFGNSHKLRRKPSLEDA